MSPLVLSATLAKWRTASSISPGAAASFPKRSPRQARAGNQPPRTIETPSGLLNAIGLDNDGIEHFISHHLPYLRTLPTAIIPNIAGKSEQEFIEMAAMLASGEPGLAAIENSTYRARLWPGGTDFATNPDVTRRIVRGVRDRVRRPTDCQADPECDRRRARLRSAAADDGGADAVSLVNTFVGMAIDWKRMRPILGNQTGGLSGPAIKPLVMRIVWQVAKTRTIPIIAVGGIASVDDVVEFLVAGASARPDLARRTLINSLHADRRRLGGCAGADWMPARARCDRPGASL